MAGQMFITLSHKLGIQDTKVIKKAEEILRLIDIKNIVVPLNGTSKLVVTLDLAATALMFPLDRNQAISLAGVNKRNYLTTLQLLEEVLNLSQNLSVKDICIRLGCMNVINEAIYIVKKYKEIHDKHNILDCERPMFLVAAVFVACKKLKTKIDQTKLVELAKVKKTMLKRIILAMEPLAHEESFSHNKPCKRAKTLLEVVEDKLKANLQTSHKKKRHDQESEEQNYDSWREKILANAAAAIASNTQRH